jgi:predicted ArsR family transcriptional regulator
MSLNIREWRQKITAYLQEHGAASLETVAQTLGIGKNSVHRHRQVILRRRRPESAWWETTVGSAQHQLIRLGRGVHG